MTWSRTLTAAIAAGAVWAAPTTVSHAGPPFDSAQGAGWLSPDTHFSFNARGNPATGDAQGRFAERHAAGSIRGEVLCLRVVGNRAVFFGRITHTTGTTLPEGSFVEWHMIDGGKEDTLFDLPGPTTLPDECPQPGTFGERPVVQGDIHVRPARP